MKFDDAILGLLRGTDEVGIETTRSDGSVHRTTIWIVADERDAYVRSVRGPRGRWYRELRDDGSGALMVDGERVPVRAAAATDPASVELVSGLLRAKYGERSAASTASMLTPETLPTTLRLEPA